MFLFINNFLAFRVPTNQYPSEPRADRTYLPARCCAIAWLPIIQNSLEIIMVLDKVNVRLTGWDFEFIKGIRWYLGPIQEVQTY